MLTGKTLGSFTCISYQEKKQMWATGWLPGTALTPVAPMPSPKISDWLGTWSHPGGGVEITRGAGGKLHIEGVMLVPAGKTTNNGVIEAQASPQNDTIAFVNDAASRSRTWLNKPAASACSASARGCWSKTTAIAAAPG